MKKPIVIVFSGGCYSGKTTTMLNLKSALEQEGYKVNVFKEPIRKKNINIDEIRKDIKQYLDFQRSEFEGRKNAECEFKKQTEYDFILVDRAISDCLFYTLFYVDKGSMTPEIAKDYNELIMEMSDYLKKTIIENYDVLLEFCPLNFNHPDVSNDQYRPNNIDYLKYVEYYLINMINRMYCYDNNIIYYIKCNMNDIDIKDSANKVLKLLKGGTDIFDNVDDHSFDEWFNNFKELNPEEQRSLLLSIIKKELSDDDSKVLDRIIELLNENKDKDTDMLFFMDKLKDEFPNITPSAIVSYMMVLKAAGYVDIDNDLPKDKKTVNDILDFIKQNENKEK